MLRGELSCAAQRPAVARWLTLSRSLLAVLSVPEQALGGTACFPHGLSAAPDAGSGGGDDHRRRLPLSVRHRTEDESWLQRMLQT